MSFALTTPQILARTKTVTRRLGWRDLKPGTLIQAVEKGQGLKKGEKVRRLAVIRVTDVRRERLSKLLLGFGYGLAEIEREGFEGQLSIVEFIEMFCRANACKPGDDVTRIVFEYVEPVGAAVTPDFWKAQERTA